MALAGPGSSGISPGLLRQMIVQNDEKHEAGHTRLRHDLTEGINDVNAQIDAMRDLQFADHETLVKQEATKERRKELSGYKAVIIAAAIGGGFRLVEVLITQIALVVRHP